ncbi:hypothetical protein C2S53_019945 [Perilla frutescens var. hirtella]|uniref:Uncharacterized protein n=1 Tax=Perilla frutescens var. hirtella TaxID=608512 RepID=A0AAD4NV70_PERFH|nr:hypothetical protein C2S53_019945 [Perilla frutescens var. hirtella]
MSTSTDDPCVSPVWDWIECNSDSNPRVIALDLNGRLGYGPLPDFSSMDALQRIDLSQNSLYEPIPSFLGTFPDLQELLFGNSQLSTSCSTSNKSPSPPADINFGGSDGGGDVYQIPSTKPKKKSNTPKILGGAISAFVVFWAGVGGFAIHRHRAKSAAAVAGAAAKQGPTDPNANMPLEEVPMNGRPNHDNHRMSPSS